MRLGPPGADLGAWGQCRNRAGMSQAIYALSPAEALRWAIDDCGPGPITPGVETDASLARYRGALLAFHRESKRVRYSKTKDAASQHPRAL